MAKTKPAKLPGKLIADNRKARFNYELSDHLEAGVVLEGTEVKSLREGKLNLGDAYCVIDKQGEVFLHDAHISAYSHGNHANHNPLRKRKLLLHQLEILRLGIKVREKGLTLIPTRVYFNRGRVKVEIALAKGKKLHDKRQVIRERDQQREARREMA